VQTEAHHALILLLSHAFFEKPDSTFSQHALEHFQVKHASSEGGGWKPVRLKENAIKQRDGASGLILSDRSL
ncbi:MAG: hypothetical protein ACOVLI_03080, partial [Rhabdaerophilum sp.]